MKLNRKRVPKGSTVTFKMPDESTFLELRVISGTWFAYFEDSGLEDLFDVTLSIKTVGDPIGENEYFSNMIGSAELKAVYRVFPE